jgi:hypothetical protein
MSKISEQEYKLLGTCTHIATGQNNCRLYRKKELIKLEDYHIVLCDSKKEIIKTISHDDIDKLIGGGKG